MYKSFSKVADRINSVITSCTTKDQLFMAKKYCHMLKKKYVLYKFGDSFVRWENSVMLDSYIDQLCTTKRPMIPAKKEKGRIKCLK